MPPKHGTEEGPPPLAPGFLLGFLASQGKVCTGTGSQSSLWELGSRRPLSDRQVCPRHADNNQASSASKAEGHTNAQTLGMGPLGSQLCSLVTLLGLLASSRW